MTSRLPGQRTGRSYTPRNVLLQERGALYLPGGAVIDATYSYDGANTSYEREIRAGVVLGKLSSGMWAPCKLTSIASGTSGSGSGASTTTFNVTDARHFEVDDIISVPTTAGRLTRTISAINYTTNVITVSVAIVNGLTTTLAQPGVGIGNCIYPHSSDPATGVEVPRAILNEFVDLIDHDDNTARDRTIKNGVIAGIVDEDLILGDLAAIRAAQAEQTTAPIAFLDKIIWADRNGISA